MAIGPGKYDDIATYVREQAWAQGVVLIVLGGRFGSGFSVQSASPIALLQLPQMLRDLAAKIDADMRKGQL
jgi:hypothetical protein